MSMDTNKGIHIIIYILTINNIHMIRTVYINIHITYTYTYT